ncbi:MAG: hypothetical protein ACRC2T_05605 [Thermoguttaceae bacterium]
MSQPQTASPKVKAPKIKPHADVYTVILAISFTAMIIGSVLLYLGVAANATLP